MSPLTVRRYRAERLLRQEFEALRGRVIASVRGRLRARGVSLDQSDLEGCYAQAWQGLYTVVLDGQEIANPAGWLTLVTFRRAIDEHRARTSVLHGEGSRGDALDVLDGQGPAASVGAHDRDFAAELDDRARLRQLFEGLRGRLSAREREAATLCYLQGLTRAEAASRMGVSDARMRKLMEGRGGGEAGVAAKVGALVATIGEGGWCEEQGSLMRGFAFGIHDPDGERYRLALLHFDECPACRAYVRSLRGIAVVLPPVLSPWALGAGALARASAHAGGGVGAGVGGGASAGGGAGGVAGAGAQAGPGLGGALSASGAAGAGGAAGGSWLLAGGTFAGKLAAGCLLALGVGAGCLALSEAPDRAPTHAHHAARRVAHGGRATLTPSGPLSAEALDPRALAGELGHAGRVAASTLTPTSRAEREFGPEQALAPVGASSSASSGGQVPVARSASSGSGPDTAVGPSSAGGETSADGAQPAGGAQPSAGEDAVKAEREFAPG